MALSIARLIRTIVTGMLLAVAASQAYAQPYPERPITLLIPYTAGGPTDISSRVAAEAVSRVLGKRLTADNRPGAGGALAASNMAQSARPDGYTLAVTPITVLRLPHISNVAFNPITDLTWIINLAGYQFGVVVRADSPWKTWKEFTTYAKANPGKVTYASPGFGTTLHITMEQIGERDGIKWTQVPFKGTADSIVALRGGHVMALTGSVPTEQIEAGLFRTLVTWGERRPARHPNAPTLKELGYGIVTNSPYGITGPKGMDPVVVKTVHDAFKAALDDAAFLKTLDRLGHDPFYMSGDDYFRWARENYEIERRIVERMGLKQ
jgi:tripartite-type tricarboxylate transporter receptor subunit TctC